MLNCFDRLVLFGTYQPLCYPQAMSWQVHAAEVKLIDYEKRFANKLRLEMKNIGAGNAVICLDGSCQKGKWNKENNQARTKFSLENGNDVKFNAGTTWIEIIRPEIEVTY